MTMMTREWTPSSILQSRFGTTPSGLARRTGLSRVTIIAIWEGYRDPSWSAALTIASALGITLTELQDHLRESHQLRAAYLASCADADADADADGAAAG